MQFAFLLPSLGYGIYLGVSSGNWALTFLSAGSVLIWLIFGRKRELTGEVTFSEGRTFLGHRRLTEWVIFWPATVREKAYQAACRKNYEFDNDQFQRLISKTPWLLGINSLGPVTLPVGKLGHHALIIGPTGSGKTELLRNLAISSKSELVAIDFKGGLGLAGLEPIRLLTNLDSEPEQFWNFLNRLLDTREAALLAGDKPEILLVIADELSSVISSSLAAQSTIERVITKGRSLGVVFVGANQTLSGIPRTIQANCLLRVMVGSIDPVDMAQFGITKNQHEHLSELGKASLVEAGKITSFEFAPAVQVPKLATDAEESNPFLARCAPMHDLVHLAEPFP